MRTLILPILLVASGLAGAATVQIDVSATFDSDVIVNAGSALDTVQDPVDLPVPQPGSPASWCYVTQTAANQLFPASPDGLPDDGLFPAAGFHPDVELAYCNGDDGLNARRLQSVGASFTFPVPPASYQELHLAVTTGSGTSDLTITLTYTDLTTDVYPALLVPDWFDDPSDTATLYHLIDGLDRVRPDGTSGYQDRDDPAIFGIRVDPNAGKTLDSVTVERTGGPAAAITNFFGATGVTVAGPSVSLPRVDLAATAMVINPGSPVPPGGTIDVDVTVSSTATSAQNVDVDLFYGPGQPVPLLPATGALTASISVPAGGTAVASFVGIPAPASPEVWRVYGVANPRVAITECDLANNVQFQSLCIAQSGCAASCGDCDESGALPPTILDALVAAQISASLLSPNQNQQCACDVNSSGTIGIIDALLMAQAAASLPAVLTCGAGGNTDVALSIVPPTTRDPVEVEFDLCGPATADLTMEFSTDGGLTHAPASATGSSPLPSPAPATPAGTLQFHWDSLLDVPPGMRPATADIRITAFDPVTGSTRSDVYSPIDLVSGTCGGTVEADLTGTPLPIVVNSTTVGADDTVAMSCGATGGPDHVYMYIPENTAQHTISLCGSAYDTSLEIRETDCVAGTSLICNDDSCGLQSEVVLTLNTGTAYWILVDGFNGASGAYTLTITSP